MLAIPQMILLVFDAVALVMAVAGALRTQNYGAAVIIYWLVLNAQHLIMALFFMSGRRNLRTTDRFYSGRDFISGKTILRTDLRFFRDRTCGAV